MSILNNHKTLARLWAAVLCDFENVLANFLGSPGWRYAHFAKVCRETKITLIMHITQGRGKAKDEHYDRVMGIILQQSKKQWLRKELVKGRTKTTSDKDMELKRVLGGFYLLYTMYEKQPIKGKVKIAVGKDDLVAIDKFCRNIKELPFKGEITFIMKYLWIKEAFHFCIYPEDFRFDHSTREFLDYSESENVGLTGRMRDIQDVLAYSSVYKEAESFYADMTIVKNKMANNMLNTLEPDLLFQHVTQKSGFATFVTTVAKANLSKALDKIDNQVDKPVVTLQGLTATEASWKRMMQETRIRMERARKKNNLSDRDASHQAAHPYVREGGIFGRKKEQDGTEKLKRRERGACNGNLWIYINGYDFDKPMGDPVPQANQKVEIKMKTEESENAEVTSHQ